MTRTCFRDGPARFVVVLLPTVVMLAACSKSATGPPAAPPALVKIAVVRSENVPIELRNIGVVQPVASVTLQSQVDGVVKDVLVQPGQHVTKGQILFQLDARPFQAALAQAQANVTVDQARVGQCQAACTTAAANWQRAKKLGTSGGALSITQYDAYHSSYQQAKYTLAAQVAQVQADRAVVQNNRVQLGYCTIRAPMDGKAGTLQAFAGTSVKTAATNLLVINQLQPIYVSFSLPQIDLPQIRQARLKNSKLPVYARPAGAPKPRLKGYMSFIDNTINAATGSIQLMGTFANLRQRLWPSEFVNVTLQVGVIPHALVVPDQAVQTGQNGNFLFVVRKNVAAIQPVTKAFTYHSLAVITKGLRMGDEVITDGQVNVIPGKAVRIVRASLIAPLAYRPRSARRRIHLGGSRGVASGDLAGGGVSGGALTAPMRPRRCHNPPFSAQSNPPLPTKAQP